MRLLGLHFDGHDTAAALLIDNQIACAISEERVDRRKHSREFPILSAKACLEHAGIEINQIDCICIPQLWDKLIRERYIKPALSDIQHVSYLLRDAAHISELLRCEEFIREKLAQGGLHYTGPIKFFDHHYAHIAYTAFTSPVTQSDFISLDGYGEIESSVVGHIDQRGREIHYQQNLPHSLGLCYAAITYYLGFLPNCDEGIVMGLASYGDPHATIPGQEETYLEFFRRMLPSDGKGAYSVNLDYFALGLMRGKWVNEPLLKALGPVRAAGGPMTKHHENIAAGLQLRLEEIVLEMARALRTKTKCDSLCLTGGVALNCVMNTKLAEQAGYREVYVSPAPGDNGLAIGATILGRQQLTGRVETIGAPDNMIGLGPLYSEQSCAQALQKHGLAAQAPSDLLAQVAKHLHDGKIVGWFDGRSEFGPRALGHRSILTRPYPAEMKDYVNARVKFREAFRPFAPVVAVEKLGQYFQTALLSPYMMHAVQVKPEMREKIAATVHVDGSCRVQTVDRRDLPRIYSLLEEFEKISGVGVILNTSFNVKGQPIVETPEDAVSSFLATNIDVLVLGQYLVVK